MPRLTCGSMCKCAQAMLRINQWRALKNGDVQLTQDPPVNVFLPVSTLLAPLPCHLWAHFPRTLYQQHC